MPDLTRIARPAALAALALGITAAGILPGCGGRKGGLRARMVLEEADRRIPIDGRPIALGRFTGFDIDNPDGPVTIIVSRRYTEAFVEGRALEEGGLVWEAYEEDWEVNPRGPWFELDHLTAGETGVVRIVPFNTLPDGTRPRVELVVKTPVADGLTIRADGDVNIHGDAQGEIRVATTGGVTVRSNIPMVEDVAIQAGDDIMLVTVPASRGSIELSAPKGRTVFDSAYGTVHSVRPEYGRYTAVWNRGGNLFTLHSEDGNANVLVREKPDMYSPYVPSWPDDWDWLKDLN